MNRKKPDPLIYILASERQELGLATMYLRKGQEILAPRKYNRMEKIDVILCDFVDGTAMGKIVRFGSDNCELCGGRRLQVIGRQVWKTA